MMKSHRQIKNSLKKKKKRDAANKQKKLERKSNNTLEKRLKRETYHLQDVVRKMTAKLHSTTHRNEEQDN
jgi:hypothetical protein